MYHPRQAGRLDTCPGKTRTSVIRMKNLPPYNIFTTMNISSTPFKTLAKLLRVLGQPDRLRILVSIGEGEACVCHLEAVLKMRQALISQHLMALRKAKLLEARREGRFVYYRVIDKEIFNLLERTALLSGMPQEQVQPTPLEGVSGCACPHCQDEGNPQLISVDQITT